MIRVGQLCFSYTKHPFIEDVSFEVESVRSSDF